MCIHNMLYTLSTQTNIKTSSEKSTEYTHKKILIKFCSLFLNGVSSIINYSKQYVDNPYSY